MGAIFKYLASVDKSQDVLVNFPCLIQPEFLKTGNDATYKMNTLVGQKVDGENSGNNNIRSPRESVKMKGVSISIDEENLEMAEIGIGKI